MPDSAGSSPAPGHRLARPRLAGLCRLGHANQVMRHRLPPRPAPSRAGKRRHSRGYAHNDNCPDQLRPETIGRREVHQAEQVEGNITSMLAAARARPVAEEAAHALLAAIVIYSFIGPPPPRTAIVVANEAVNLSGEGGGVRGEGAGFTSISALLISDGHRSAASATRTASPGSYHPTADSRSIYGTVQRCLISWS